MSAATPSGTPTVIPISNRILCAELPADPDRVADLATVLSPAANQSQRSRSAKNSRMRTDCSASVSWSRRWTSSAYKFERGSVREKYRMHIDRIVRSFVSRISLRRCEKRCSAMFRHQGEAKPELGARSCCGLNGRPPVCLGKSVIWRRIGNWEQTLSGKACDSTIPDVLAPKIL